MPGHLQWSWTTTALIGFLTLLCRQTEASDSSFGGKHRLPSSLPISSITVPSTFQTLLTSVPLSEVSVLPNILAREPSKILIYATTTTGPVGTEYSEPTPHEGLLSCNPDLGTCAASVDARYVDAAAATICEQLQNKDFTSSSAKIEETQEQSGITLRSFAAWEPGCTVEKVHHFNDDFGNCENMFKATVFNCPNQGSGGSHTEGCVNIGIQSTCG